jgi:hypothetical protein
VEYIPIVRTASASPPPPPSGDAIIADHTVIDLFNLIPDGPVQAASGFRVLQMHQSTGNRISRHGLECLQGTNRSDVCNTYPDYKYDRRNWTWEIWDTPTSDAANKLAQFVDEVNSRNAAFDVFGMKFCFLDTRHQSFEAYRDAMLQLEATYPDKRFLWWTQAIRPLWPSNVAEDCEIIQNFNNQVREYALENGKPLLDMADIESHDANGNACYTGCESTCGEWGAEGLDTNGHLNFDGALRIAKAYWWLMARVAGWDGHTQ